MGKVLRPALMIVGENKDIIPVRGPKHYLNRDNKYNFTVSGNLECFEGIETIYKDNIKIYELKCHGAIIKR